MKQCKHNPASIWINLQWIFKSLIFDGGNHESLITEYLLNEKRHCIVLTTSYFISTQSPLTSKYQFLKLGGWSILCRNPNPWVT